MHGWRTPLPQRHARDTFSRLRVTSSTATQPLLELAGIRKTWPGVVALDGVDFDLRAGEVHALVGENGAGKSTLMKALSGAERPDAGTLRLGGELVELTGPRDALDRGIHLIYQEFNLVPEMTCAENIFLGREPMLGLGLVDRRRMEYQAAEVMAQLGLTVAPSTKVATLSVAEQQMLEIARALSARTRVLAMDEPSATLTEREIVRLFAVIRGLKQQGVGIIYISHRLDEVFALADRVTVLRDGRKVWTGPTAELTRDDIVRKMVGRELAEEFPARHSQPGEELLRVADLTGARYRDVSFTLRRGEILGIAGLVGAGRTEVLMGLIGAPPPRAGTIHLQGRAIAPRDPRHALDLGIGLLTEDRKQLGIIPERPVRENLSLSALREFLRLGCVRRGLERQATDRKMDELRVRGAGPETAIKNLSGGNQQKVLLGRLLLTGAQVLLFDEPTRGIDVGAKAEIYALLDQLAQRGVGIVMVSSELPEVLHLSDRVLVMHEGRMAGILERGAATPERVMHLATGGG